MNFPKNRMRFVSSQEGGISPAGWLELDVRAVDLEGAGRIYIDLAEVDRLRTSGDHQEEALDAVRRLLGG
jgi:hypothetical protein